MSAARSIDLLDQARQVLSEPNSERVCLVDVQQLSGRSQLDPNTIGIGEGLEPKFILEIAAKYSQLSICQPESVEYETELNASARMLLTPDDFFKMPLTLILEPKARSNRDAKLTSYSLTFTKAAEKRTMLADLEKSLIGLVKAESLRAEICTVADELFTNAVYNAPFVNAETNLNPGISRERTEIEMPKPHKGYLFVGHDSTRIVIGCRDSFGTLNLNKLLQRIQSCYDNGVASSINMGNGGAGIGSYMVYNTGSSYFAGVRKGALTQVVCVVPLKMSSRRRSELSKNLHFFQE